MRSFLLLLLVAPLVALAQPDSTPDAPFGPRLGDTIDPAARDYFLLFPDVAGFESAALALEDDGNVRVTVQRRARPDTVIVVQEEALVEIVDILRRYETYGAQRVRIRESLRRVHPDLPVVFGSALEDPQRVSPNQAREIEVVLVSGEVIPCTVLHVTDDALVVWTDRTPYFWTRAVGAVALSAREVETVRWEISTRGGYLRHGLLAATGGVGATAVSVAAPRRPGDDITGAVGVGILQVIAAARPPVSEIRREVGGRAPLPGDVARDLRGAQVFRRLPPELSELADEAARRPAPERSGSPLSFFSVPEVHVGLTTSARMGQEPEFAPRYATDFSFAIPFGFYYEDASGSTRPTARHLQADVAVSVLERVRVGAEWTRAGAPESGLWTLSVRESSLSLYAEADAVRPDAALRIPLGLFAGVGVGRTSREAWMPLSFAPPVVARFVGVVPGEYRAESRGVSWLARAGLDVYADWGASLRVLATYRGLPAFDLAPDITAPYGQNNVPAVDWEPVSLPTSAFEIAVGTRLHF